MSTVSKTADFLLHLLRDMQVTTVIIKGHRSALSSPMTFRGLNIYRIPDLNALIRSFNVERPSTARETP